MIHLKKIWKWLKEDRVHMAVALMAPLAILVVVAIIFCIVLAIQSQGLWHVAVTAFFIGSIIAFFIGLEIADNHSRHY